MKYYYIDSENRGPSDWIPNIPKLKYNDTVFIFSSKGSHKIPLDCIRLIQNSVCVYSVINCTTNSRNAMDFIIATKLGEMCNRSPKSNHYIISGDKGYTPIVDYWNRLGVSVVLTPSIKIE